MGNQGTATLERAASLPSSTQWPAPRLSGFLLAHLPHVSVNLPTGNLGLSWFAGYRVLDAAIYFRRWRLVPVPKRIF